MRDIRCLRLSPNNLASCLASGQVACDQTAFERGAAEGRLTWDAGAAGKCLDQYGLGSCESVPINCAGVFEGTVPPDGGCFIPEECRSDGFCFQYDNLCPHRCRPYSASGETCNGFDRLCKPPGGCELVDAGVVGCVEKRDAGTPCILYSSCGLNMACNSGACIEIYARAGQPCGISGGYPFCEAEYFCRQPPPPSGGGSRPPGTCELKSGVGGVCAGYGSCLPSLLCSGLITTATCVGKAALGQTCRQYGDCQDLLYCNPATARCAPLPGDGGDCTPSGSFFLCAPGFWCDTSSPLAEYRCRPRQALGTACSYDLVCLSNNCDYGTLPDGGTGAVCVPACSQRADGGL